MRRSSKVVATSPHIPNLEELGRILSGSSLFCLVSSQISLFRFELIPRLQIVISTGPKRRGVYRPIYLLKEYCGYLQTDGYGVYEHVSIGGRKEITLLHCMAHARRYFEKALDNDKPRAEHFLTEI